VIFSTSISVLTLQEPQAAVVQWRRRLPLGSYSVLTAVGSIVRPESYQILWCHLDSDGQPTYCFQLEHAKALECFLDQTTLKQRLYKCLFGAELLFTVDGSEHDPTLAMVHILKRDFSDLDPVFTITERAEDKHKGHLPSTDLEIAEPESFPDFPLPFPVYALVSKHRVAGESPSVEMRWAGIGLKQGHNESVDGILDAALEIAAKLADILHRMKAALLAGDDETALRLARELCGLENTEASWENTRVAGAQALLRKSQK